MNLLSCYIENFGTFHQISFTFTCGLNVFKKENGWGKTTLAAFLKAMFFGLEYKQRSRELYERSRYLPWQGGNYGGSLVFENNGREYKIIRSFGKKNTDDDFALYDNLTNKPSGDYSSRIGEELFGIDCDSFERSLFITPEGKTPALQDNLSAKLGHLIDNTDDINNFESACHTLDTLATSIKAKRGSGGKLGEIENRIRTIQEQIKECKDAETEMALLQDKLDHCNQQKKELDLQRSALREEMLKREDQNTKREYDQLLARKEAKESQADQLYSIMGGKPLSQDDSNHYMSQARALERLYHKLEESPIQEKERLQFQKLREFFASGVPSPEDLEACRKKLSRCREMEQELTECYLTDEEYSEYQMLSQEYCSQPPTQAEIDRYLDDYANSVRLKEILTAKTLDWESRKADHAHQRGKRTGKWMLLLGIVCFLGGALLLTVSIPMGIAVLAGAIMLVFAGVLSRSSSHSSGKDKEDSLIGLEEEIRQLSREQQELEQEYNDFLTASGYDDEIDNIPLVLSNLKVEVAHFWELDAQYCAYQERKEQLQEERIPLMAFCNAVLKPFQTRYPSMDEHQLLTMIQEKRLQYQTLSKQVQEYNNTVKQFNNLSRELTAFLSSCVLPHTEANDSKSSSVSSLLHKVEYIRDVSRDYEKVQMELLDLDQMIYQFCQMHDMEALTGLTSPERTLEELQEELEDYDRKSQELGGLLTDYQKSREMQSLIADKRMDLESEWESLNLQREDLRRKHQQLTKALDYLQQARDRLSTGYLGSTRDAFQRYLSLLDGNPDDILLDTELHTSMEGYGKLWDSAYFSSGYKDLVNLCIRLALADAMYHGKPPFLILDDPFTNLDEDKLDHALSFLKKLALQTQIFYFSCHNSRCPVL